MNDKFFTLAPEKQNRILNAGFHIFSHYGYKHASTEMIAREADISKGLLFHYFGSKKDFYLYLYDYALESTVKRLSELHDYSETDLFKICIDAQMRKLDIAAEYPDLTQFLIQAYLEEDPQVALELSSSFQVYLEQSMERTLERVDRSKFKDSITAEQAMNVIIWMSEGFSKAFTPEDLNDIEGANSRFLDYMEILRQHFYREEYL